MIDTNTAKTSIVIFSLELGEGVTIGADPASISDNVSW